MNYVIIGNSSAAIGCIEGIRKVDQKGSITVISDEPYHAYGRPLISYYLKGSVSLEQMNYRSKTFYEDNKCTLLLGETVTSIHTLSSEVILESGKKVEYDKLLIATGSRPFIPPMQGLNEVEKKFNFMKLDDAKAIKSILKPSDKVLVIGAGLIGLKACEGIYETTQNITVVDLADRILPSILDVTGSNIVKEHLESKGIRFILKDSVENFTTNTALLKSGQTVDFDIVIVAVGVKPNIELAKEAGIDVNKGIITDENQETSISNIYAAGDCTESMDICTQTRRVLALLPNAYMQGETAGLTMAGSEKPFTKAIPMNAIGFFGLHMTTAGSYDGEAFIEQTKDHYKKLIFKDGLLKGYILIGDVKRCGIYTSIIKEQIPLDTLDLEKLKEAPQMLIFNKDYRTLKLGGINPVLGGEDNAN